MLVGSATRRHRQSHPIPSSSSSSSPPMKSAREFPEETWGFGAFFFYVGKFRAHGARQSCLDGVLLQGILRSPCCDAIMPWDLCHGARAVVPML